MTTGIYFDDTQWPIVIINYGPSYTPERWTEHLEEAVGYMNRGEPFGFISDLRRAQVPGAVERKEAAEFTHNHASLIRACVVGWASVHQSAVTRGVLTAMSWVRPFPFTPKACATVDEARAWLHSRLRQRVGV